GKADEWFCLFFMSVTGTQSNGGQVRRQSACGEVDICLFVSFVTSMILHFDQCGSFPVVAY
ncbi:MAG: hypothetical protein ACI33P_14175, partial [Lysinibacillus sp.]